MSGTTSAAATAVSAGICQGFPGAIGCVDVDSLVFVGVCVLEREVGPLQPTIGLEHRGLGRLSISVWHAYQ